MIKPDFQNSHEREIYQEEIRDKLLNFQYLPRVDEVVCAYTDEDSNPLINDWLMFLESSPPRHEVWTVEYIEALAAYLSDRSRLIEGRLGVLDLGAGDGSLGFHLNLKSRDFHVRSVDTHPLGKSVEMLSFVDALEKYRPEIVMVSWMPDNEDWMGKICSKPHVKEVILIGPTDSEICGHPEKTWGVVKAKPMEVSAKASYIKHGFERVDLDALSAKQICRLDLPPDFYNSCTVSFRRLD